MTELAQFKVLLKEYRGAAIWAAGGSVAIPIVAEFVTIVPPYPDGVSIITAIFQLLVLALVF